jgi:type II secretion system protein J
MNPKGITLIELLISFCISAFIMAGAYQVFINQAKTYEVQEVLADAQNSVRSGMQIMTDDLRIAGYDKEGGGSNVPVGAWNPIPVHETSSIRVEWEQDNNTIKAVQYFLSDEKLQRKVYMNGVLTDSPQVVLDDVTKLTFAYTLSGTKVVRVDVTLAVKNRSLSSTVIFRNIK